MTEVVIEVIDPEVEVEEVEDPSEEEIDLKEEEVTEETLQLTALLLLAKQQPPQNENLCEVPNHTFNFCQHLTQIYF